MPDRQVVRLLLKWFHRHARDLPWRRTSDPYSIWVSEIMLQQTQVKTVIPFWNRWVRALPDVTALAKARPERLHKLWEGLGYYTRVRNMQRAAKLICERHGGRFPTRFEQVLDLPGIGRYTAGAICSIAYNQPTPILDGNVIRVLSRLFCIEGDPLDKRVNSQLWGIAERLVRCASRGAKGGGRDAPALPELGTRQPGSDFRAASALNQALMELGALVCTPRSPRCDICPLRRGCMAFVQGRVAQFPQARRRPQVMSRRFVAFAVRHADKFLVRQRGEGVVNAHLWEFPNVEATDGLNGSAETARRVLGVCPQQLEPLCVVKHSITRYRVTLEIFRGVITAPGEATRCGVGEWVTRGRLARLPFASAHKKALRHLLRLRA